MKSGQREGIDYAIVGGLSTDENGIQSISIYKGGWIIRVTLAVESTGPVISGLSVTSENAGIPPGGLTKTFLNAIPLSAIQAEIRKLEASLELLDQLKGPFKTVVTVTDEGFPPELLAAVPKNPSELFEPIRQLFPAQKTQVIRKRGRPGRPLRFYAEVAWEYDQAMRAKNPSPRSAVATRFRLSSSKARDAVSRARAEGFLTETRTGFAGGRITTKALAMLKETGQGKRGTQKHGKHLQEKVEGQKRRRPRK